MASLDRPAWDEAGSNCPNHNNPGLAHQGCMPAAATVQGMISSDVTDEYGPGPPVDALRWLGAVDDPAGRQWHKPTDAAVEALRAKLAANNGMKGLEIVDPAEPGYAKRAARLFLRDGFVAVLNVLEPARLEVCRSGCIKVVRRILATDPTGGGNGHPSYVHSSHRYSITGEGAVIGNMGATPEFAYFVDPPVLTEVLTEIYGSADYICNGFGGDFCLPGCVAYQPLHSDMAGAFKVKKQERDDPEYEDRLSLSEPNETGEEYEYKNGFHDPSGRLDYRDLPPSYVVAVRTNEEFCIENENFCIENDGCGVFY